MSKHFDIQLTLDGYIILLHDGKEFARAHESANVQVLSFLLRETYDMGFKDGQATDMEAVDALVRRETL
jgi:hypothetical protein